MPVLSLAVHRTIVALDVEGLGTGAGPTRTGSLCARVSTEPCGRRSAQLASPGATATMRTVVTES